MPKLKLRHLKKVLQSNIENRFVNVNRGPKRLVAHMYITESSKVSKIYKTLARTLRELFNDLQRH